MVKNESTLLSWCFIQDIFMLSWLWLSTSVSQGTMCNSSSWQCRRQWVPGLLAHEDGSFLIKLWCCQCVSVSSSTFPWYLCVCCIAVHTGICTASCFCIRVERTNRKRSDSLQNPKCVSSVFPALSPCNNLKILPQNVFIAAHVLCGDGFGVHGCHELVLLEWAWLCLDLLN